MRSIRGYDRRHSSRVAIYSRYSPPQVFRGEWKSVVGSGVDRSQQRRLGLDAAWLRPSSSTGYRDGPGTVADELERFWGIPGVRAHPVQNQYSQEGFTENSRMAVIDQRCLDSRCWRKSGRLVIISMQCGWYWIGSVSSSLIYHCLSLASWPIYIDFDAAWVSCKREPPFCGSGDRVVDRGSRHW